jgi:hypothetical protein
MQMRPFSTTVGAALIMVLGACSSTADVAPPAALLDREWHNTFRKTESGYDVYALTSAGSNRNLEIIRLNSDGTSVETGLDPVDSPETRPGTWETAGGNTYRIRFTDPQRAGFVLEVKSIEDNQLVARRR